MNKIIDAQPVRIGVMGAQGSFTEMASLKYAAEKGIPDAELVYLEVAGRVMEAVESKAVDIGIIPLYNSTMGMVESSLRAIAAGRGQLIAMFPMKIEPCLLVREATQAFDITQIVSMEPALLQCGRYFAEHFPSVPTVNYPDTGKAAQDLASGVLPTTSAVVAPETAAAAYGLEILAKGIHDEKTNTTTFVVLESISK